jgi:hypothetical protein
MACLAGVAPRGHAGAADVSSYQWAVVNDAAPWGARAGLQVVDRGGTFFLLGGRTPRPPGNPPIPGDSDIWGDVWVSRDRGASWKRVLATDDTRHWPARAYFQALRKGRFLYVVGGQNYRVEPSGCPPFIPGCPPLVSRSDFFNDAWRSRDGVAWERMTADAGWAGRAGLSAVVHRGELYVLGGSRNDDAAIIGGPPARLYFNDVWKSRDGRTWTQVTANAPWAPRAGGVVTVKNGWMYLLGGENGFTCSPLPSCAPPYFNDVWRSRDGAAWEQVTGAAEWPARPGHQCVVVRNQFVCFGGFGLLRNPTDIWVSGDGARWKQVSDAPWNATSPDAVKYDFDALATGGRRPEIFTFGGDRETFDFADPTNYLRVDDDVWRFAPPRSGR